MPYSAPAYDARLCPICQQWFQPLAINAIVCGWECSKKAALLRARNSRRERKAKRLLLEKMRPGSLTTLEKL
jgi:hypothetical protein